MFGRSESAAVTGEIKLVLFDMDNVLCDYEREKRVAFLAELAGITSEAVYKAIWASGFEFLGDTGALDASDYLRGFGERIGYSLSLDEWVEARRRSMQAKRAMLEIADSLRKTVDIAVLTNNTTLVADHIDTLLPDLRPLFGSQIYTSAQFKTAKPDPRCYRRCLSELNVRPEMALFVDDVAANVAGAREAGLSAHHHTSVQAFKQALSEHGLLHE
ncbi:HAD family phosphatase [Bradyrhizobium sp. 180]|uniref:HAD family hydrolase n=1 Tax=unclassified Bradyrhizobium TaxID=2631580 RepID=UPI001FFBE3EA|nr:MULTISPECIES: HAD family phosphatase [unclassified Bradyrhizobium]MCK1423348.1 HAD family phosphatase [Bradyrhizobium sp. CW12]MCK1493739.1 HAD family phosphatase [Bradyrhizobium sp. 180]MCK1528177.1 HAD family phosphatase [Bradyrhizobium sp. 182]MCK1598526.1 HAD family phosphatase [Bradyrhizobium sp. 164]MCK1617669.1 HAD family phosphatase [Bradyrhizobium sp. 159]